MVVHAGQAAGVVAGLRGGVADVGGGEPAGRVAADQEVLHLGADVEVHVGLAQYRLEDHARSEGPGCAADVRVAVDEGEAVADPGQGCVRRRVGHRDQVGVAGRLPDRTHGETGEPDAVGLEGLGGLDGDELGAGLAGEVDEQGEEEGDVVGAGTGGQILI